MVAARRSFVGTLPLERMRRLTPSLAATHAEVVYNIEFGKDELAIPYVWLRAQTSLALVCQTGLEHFVLPVAIDTHLGLIADEQDEAGLPSGYEPLLSKDGQLSLVELIEDELILSLPLVPKCSEHTNLATIWSTESPDKDQSVKSNPFAELKKLKRS